MKLADLLHVAIGAVSGASFGLALAVAAIQAEVLPNLGTVTLIGAVLGLTGGLLIAHRLTAIDCPQPEKSIRAQAFEGVVVLYHAGAAILFAALFAWGFDFGLRWHGDASQRHYLELAILGYGFLRLWVVARRLWMASFGTEPLFFLGLAVGTFPPLLSGFGEAKALAPVANLVEPVLLIVSLPGRAAAVFNTLYMNWFREQVLYILCGSLGWAFLFAVIQLILSKRRPLTA